MHEDCQTNHVLAHERLSIVGLDKGAQPLFNNDKTIALCVNGEIYNHKSLSLKECHDYKFSTNSDCECIIPLYEKYDGKFIDLLDGIFGFVLYDTEKRKFIAARDAIGVCSMYIGWHHSGSIWFASEMKALDECTLVKEFPPGHYWASTITNSTMDLSQCQRWYNPIWLDEAYLPSEDVDYEILRTSLEESVIKRLMADVPFGVLLSGGLDSSLIASIVANNYRLKMEETSREPHHGYLSSKVHTFSIGLDGSPDLEWANKVANFIGSTHHSFTFTVQEGLDALHDVINHIETYDVTTVRASTPMFLMARRIKAMGIKMVLSGEGSDEIFGGYLYFHKAPSAEEFHKELVRKISALSKYDCLRANKSTYAWGVETRVPFLDKSFLNIAMKLDAKHKMINCGQGRIEKYILRKAFDTNKTNGEPYLPEQVLWRQKEQFSDGVGYSWIDGLKDHADRVVNDQQLKMASIIFPYNTPATKEAYLYRTIFVSIFSKESFAKTVPHAPSIACSTPVALQWDEQWAKNADPSGRSISVHTSSLKVSS